MNHLHLHCLFLRGGKRLLVARADGNALIRAQSPARNIDEIAAKASNSRAKPSVCSRSQPPATQSVAETLTPSGLPAGHTARIAAKTSSGKRSLLASEPP